MTKCRIPVLPDERIESVSEWFATMSICGLLFHPDDTPADIVDLQGKSLFDSDECRLLEDMLAHMFARFGDAVYEVACPVFLQSLGIAVEG